MKSKLSAIIVSAALSASALAFASTEPSVLAMSQVETNPQSRLTLDSKEALAPATSPSLEADKAGLAGMKDTAKKKWNSFKKGVSNAMGKRVKGHTKTANLHSAKGKKNLRTFLNSSPPSKLPRTQGGHRLSPIRE